MPGIDGHRARRILLLELMREGAVVVQTPYAASPGGPRLAVRTIIHFDGDVIITAPGNGVFDPGAYARHTAAVQEVVQRLRREAGLVVAALKAGGCGLFIIRWCAAAWASVGTLLLSAEHEAASLGLEHFHYLYDALSLVALTEVTRLYGRWQIRSWLRKYGYG